MASGKDDADRSSDSPSALKNPYKDPDDGRQRFLLELEFVQCLANPTYIHYLAQNRYFEDEAFIGYLKYLQYWQRPEYIKFIMYPHCLFFLELLQNANFRNAMAHPGSKELAHRQQYFFWKNYRNNRLKHILPRPIPEPAAPPAPAPVPAPLPAPSPAPVPSMTTAAAPALSPMQFVGAPGSALQKTDMRNAMGDRRKRKYNLCLSICIHIQHLIAQLYMNEGRLKGQMLFLGKGGQCWLLAGWEKAFSTTWPDSGS
ncbi:mediator of RNA polymerase II transcription subunit 31 isoform X3 [Phoenix dactylifera]|uniref:Mediator of RNA polymerase II transcription subunit 31 n=1 Tax=Phoenix dactylifera TaxID=42345 RepID=A0A8B8ZMT3_PHODC|nr:mediator of RNA polymerase II transcription subunit 31 isoform X3 [Phoenix dactylifera]